MLAVPAVAAPDSPGLIAAARREVWTHLPAWFFLFYGCLILNTLLTNLTPARPDLAYTAVFPLLVFAGYYAVRALRASDVQRRLPMLATALALAVVLPVTNYLWHRPSPLSTQTLRDLYEVTNFIWVAVLFFHAWRTRPTHALLLFGAGLFYGVLLENIGIVLGYFHELHLRARLPPLVAPVSTMIGWSLVLYMAFFVVWGLRAWVPFLKRSALLSGFLVAVSATLLDLEIDPVATSVGCWVWDPSLPPALGPVPMVNFVAWVSALAPYASLVFLYQDRVGLDDHSPWSRRHLLVATAAAPVALALAAVVFLTLITLTEGVHGPSWAVLFRFLGAS